MKTELTILGSGGSAGVPYVGVSGWGKCDPANPRNRRQRPCAHVVHNGRRYLIDCGPDIRNQLLTHNIRRLDAILMTHDHADHIGGLDDIRHLQWEQPGRVFPFYATEKDQKEIAMRFHYCLTRDDEEFTSLWSPFVQLETIERHGDRLPMDPTIQTVEIDHHVTLCTGWKFGDNLAYCLDCVDIPEKSLEMLEGVDTWVVDCMREKPHLTHAHLDRVLEWRERIKPRLTILSSLSNEMDYDTLMAKLPEGVVAGYDGLQVEIEAAQSAIAAE
ncbi:MAG: MBL fold metallo-hydrolase [Alphaproteobacteria bacterium]